MFRAQKRPIKLSVKGSVAMALLRTSGALDCATHGQAYYTSSWPSSGVLYLASPEACQAACMGNPTCNAWTFLSDSASCWQLPTSEETNQVENEHASSGTRKCKLGADAMPAEATPSATLVTAPPNSPKSYAASVTGLTPDSATLMKAAYRPACSFKGKAYNDAAVKSPNGGTLEDASSCQRACQYASACCVFTYYVDSKACWLQGANSTEFTSEVAVGGPKSCAPPKLVEEANNAEVVAVPSPVPMNMTAVEATMQIPACATRGKAYRDKSITTPTGAYVADPKSCQVLCEANATCVYFTFYVNSRACWLQTEQVTEFVSEDAVSGPKACASPQAISSDYVVRSMTTMTRIATKRLIDEDLLTSRHNEKTVQPSTPGISWMSSAIVGLSMLCFVYVGCAAVKAMRVSTDRLRSFAQCPASPADEEVLLECRRKSTAKLSSECSLHGTEAT